jgi:hypothetical protein
MRIYFFSGACGTQNLRYLISGDIIFSVMTLSVMTFSITTISIMTFSVMALGITVIYHDTQHNGRVLIC